MRLLEELKRAVGFLAQYPGQWAVCGGVAASIYRNSPRFTDDIDFALVDSAALSAEELAVTVITQLGFKEYVGFLPDPRAKERQLRALICARTTADERFAGIDFLLPVQCWVAEAVMLAQSNRIDYGFDRLPTLTPESLIFAKLVAVAGAPDRYQDLDDIKAIKASIPISLEYITALIAKHSLEVPPEVRKLVFGP